MRIWLKNGSLFGHPEAADVLIEGERIIAVGRGLEAREGDGAGRGGRTHVIDISGRTVLPAFVDSHTHLDKALIIDLITNESGTLEEAVRKYRAFAPAIAEDDVHERALRAARMAVANGTGALRTHVNVGGPDGIRLLRPVLAVREELRDELLIQIVALPFAGEERSATVRVVEEALQAGAEVVGGAPNLHPDPRWFIDAMFDIARDHAAPLDFHVDENEEPSADVLEYLAEKTLAEGWQGRVTAGHCCSLSYVSQQAADRVIGKVREAGLNVITLPSCNMFLMGRRAPGPKSRGVTRVNELLAAGVNVAYASDNIRDPFRPFGNLDMLEEGLFTAQVIQRGYGRELLEVLRMGTYAGARAMGLEGYGLEPGCYADLVVLEAPDPVEAILTRARRALVFHRGKVIR